MPHTYPMKPAADCYISEVVLRSLVRGRYVFANSKYSVSINVAPRDWQSIKISFYVIITIN